MNDLKEIEDVDFYEDPSIRLHKLFEKRPSSCPIQDKINFGNFNNVLKNIEDFKKKKEMKLDVLFFYLVNNLVNESKKIKITKDKINYVYNVNSNDELTMLFFNSKGFIDIDEYNINNDNLKEEHKKYKMLNSDNKMYMNIHYTTIYKIINYCHLTYLDAPVSSKLQSIETLDYYLNVFDLILYKRSMCDYICKTHIDINFESKFNLFLLDISELKLQDINKNL